MYVLKVLFWLAILRILHHLMRAFISGRWIFHNDGRRKHFLSLFYVGNVLNIVIFLLWDSFVFFGISNYDFEVSISVSTWIFYLYDTRGIWLRTNIFEFEIFGKIWVLVVLVLWQILKRVLETGIVLLDTLRLIVLLSIRFFFVQIFFLYIIYLLMIFLLWFFLDLKKHEKIIIYLNGINDLLAGLLIES